LIAIIFGFLILGSLEEQAGGEDEEEASPYPFYYLSRQKNLFLLVWKWFCLCFPTFRTSKAFFLVSFLIMSGDELHPFVMNLIISSLGVLHLS
jgi:hypothetical protein